MDLAVLPTTREEAKRLGAKHYFTGKPCKHGHIAIRVTKGTCTICRKIEWERTNEQRKNKPKSEASKNAGKRYYQKNKELVKQKASARSVEKKREARRRWATANIEKRRIYTNTRRRRLRDATPVWQSEADRIEIRQIYEKAARWSKETNIRYVVDHVIPLQSKYVCGLHVPENLQVIPHSANVSKGNKFSV